MSFIIIGSCGKNIKKIDIQSGECIDNLVGHTNVIRSVSINFDNTKIVSGSDDKTVRIWDFNIGQCIHTLEAHTHWINSISFSPDSSKIVSVSCYNIIKNELFDPTSNILPDETTLITIIRSHNDLCFKEKEKIDEIMKEYLNVK